MTIWLIFAAMTVTAGIAVLWPLARRRQAGPESDVHTRFYRDQLAETQLDVERGLISPAEAEAARAEAARRLLRSDATGKDARGPDAEAGQRWAASALAVLAVPLVAVAAYGAYGSPQLGDRPLAARLRETGGPTDLAGAVARIEAHLARHPEDGRGWEVVAPVYLRGGRIEDAVKAYEAALRLLGETAPRLSSLGEAMVAARDGLVPAEARAAFERALVLDPASPKAKFYLAEAAEQDGELAKARELYGALIDGVPADAPWVPLVRDRLARLQGGPVAALAGRGGAEQEATIRGMVEGLAARLDQGGGSPEEWSRLVRSYAVLGDAERARDALDKARRQLSASGASLEAVERVAREAGLLGTGQP